MNLMINIAIMASGNGSNAEEIIKFFQGHNSIKIELVLSNKQDAGVINRAKRLGVETIVFSKEEMISETFLLHFQKRNIGLIVLAGFLWKIPLFLIKAYPDKIINVHPSLLPKYGGKGMYGMRVHDEVIRNRETESGITIHLVNDKYDDGKILFQAKISVDLNDTAEKLAEKIHKVEHQNYPSVIEKFALGVPT